MVKINKRILAFVLALQVFAATLPIYAKNAESTAENGEVPPGTIQTAEPATQINEEAPRKYSYSIAGLGDITDAYTEQLGASAKYYRYNCLDGNLKQVAFVVTADASRGAFIKGAELGDAFSYRGKVSSLRNDPESHNKLIAGVNADFFSTKTGVPMGVYIEEGRFVSSSDKRYSIGIDAEGNVFMGKVDDKISIIHNEKKIKINYLNKYPTIYGPYLLTRDYADTTRLATNVPSTEYIIALDSDIYFGTQVYGEVTEIRKGVFNGEIPENCAVLVVPDSCATRAEFEPIAIGDSVHLEATANEMFTYAWNAIGGGDVILIDGEPTDWLTDESIETTRNPRTAVGVTAEGNLVLVVVDGRRSAYSSGVKMTALAETMKALGCVYAINLDGGGSSVMVHFTEDTSKIVNSPSDGSERKVPNAVLLYEDTEISANLHSLSLGSDNSLVLCGSALPLEAVIKNADGSIADMAINEQNAVFEVDELFGRVEFIDGVPHFIAADIDGIGKISATVQIGDETISADMFLRVTSKIDSFTADRKLVFGETDGSESFTVSAKFNGEEVFFGGLLEINCDNDTFSVVCDGREVHISRVATNELTGATAIVNLALSGISVSVTAYFDSKLSLDMYELIGKSLGVSNEGYTLFYDAQSGRLTIESPVPEETTAVPEETTAVPEETIAVPEETTAVPEETTAVPEETTAVPEETTAVTEETTAVPEETTAVTEETTAPEPVFEPFDVKLQIKSDSFTTGSLDGRRIWMWADGLTSESEPYAVFEITAPDGKKTEKIVYFEKYYDFLVYNGSSLLSLPMDFGEGTATLKTLFAYTAFDDVQKVTLGSILLSRDFETNLYADTAAHWSEYYVNALSYMGIVGGSEDSITGETVFIPDSGLSREQFAKILVNYLKIDVAKYDEQPLDFADSHEIADWALPYVRAAVGASLMRGRSVDDMLIFAPRDGITRQEAIYVLGGLLGETQSASLEFTDSDNVAEWARENLEKAVAAGLISGYDDGSIRPDGGITRAEAATVVVRMYNFMQKAEKVLATEDE